MRIPTDEARRAFGHARVARLATVDADAAPHLVPITFALTDEDTVVFAVDHKPKSTQNLRRLRNIATNPLVSLLADRYSDDWSQLWWVRADGRAALLDDERREPALAALAAKYPQYVTDPPAGPVVAIRIQRWRGWSATG